MLRERSGVEVGARQRRVVSDPAWAGDLDRVAGGEDLAAAFADAALADVAATDLVEDHFGRAAGGGGVAVAPAEQGDQGRPEVEALLGQEVFVAGRAFLVGPPFEDVLVDEALQARRQDVAGDAQRGLDLAEAAV